MQGAGLFAVAVTGAVGRETDAKWLLVGTFGAVAGLAALAAAGHLADGRPRDAWVAAAYAAPSAVLSAGAAWLERYAFAVLAASSCLYGIVQVLPFAYFPA